MPRIEQLYCTHCTYGSSAIERREGEMADRVVGYSARASSLEVNELKKCYRNIERFMYYYLPDDTPGEEKLRLTAATAPRRFFFSPSVNGVQVLGQLSYRQTDTVGRPVSYFAHVLCGDVAAGVWNVLDCLRLWGAPWRDEDSPDIEFTLPALSSLNDLRNGGGRPTIDDRLLLDFLTAEPGAEWHDPGRIVPDRWKTDKPAAERLDLLKKLLGSYLKVGPSRRENVLVVAEPAVAALLFYGVARLLPAGKPTADGQPTIGLREEISFSTFEPKIDRLLVSLAATDFYAYDETVDKIKPEAYRGRNYIYNTYNGKNCEPQSPHSEYVDLVLATLLENGWGAVDRMLAAFQNAGAKTAQNLESLARTHGWVNVLLDPAADPGNLAWPAPTDKVPLDYLAQVVRPRLVDKVTAKAIVDNPVHLLRILSLVATEPPRDGDPVGDTVERLLEAVRESDFSELLASPRIAAECKLAALVSFVRRQRKFPDNCDTLWTAPADRVLPHVIEALPDDVVSELLDGVPPARKTALLLKIAQANAKHGLARKLISLLEEQPLCDLLERHRGELKTLYPALDATAAVLARPNDPDLARRLEQLLADLPFHPERFEKRHDLLTAWKDCFADPNRSGALLGAWNVVRQQLGRLSDPTADQASGMVGKLFNKSRASEQDLTKIGDALAKAIKQAMPDIDDPLGSIRATRLQELGKVITGKSPLLPTEQWTRVTNYLHYGDYTVFVVGQPEPTMPGGFKRVEKRAAKQSALRSIQLGPINLEQALYAAALVVPLGIGAYVFWPSSSAADRANQEQIAALAAQQEAEKEAAKKKADDEAAKAAAREASKKAAAAEKNPKEAAPARTNNTPPEPGPGTTTTPATTTDPKPPDPKPTNTAAAQTPSNAKPAATESTVSFTYVKPPPPPVADAEGAAEVVDLVKWRDPPKPNWQLAYHAPATASKLLDIQSEGQDVTLSIKIDVLGGNPAGPPGPLCRLYIADSCLRFQWLAKEPIAAAALGCVEGGVLRIHAGDDKWSQYIAFYEQVRVKELPLKEGGSAVIKSPDGKPIPFKQPTFFLGHGKLHLDDGSEVKFETPKSKSQSVDLADVLRERMDASEIHVRLEKLAGSPGNWQLKVDVTPKDAAGKLRKELDSLKSLQTVIGKHLPVIMEQDLKTASITKKVTAAKALAEILKLTYPKEPTDQPPIDKKGRDELKRYSDEVMDNIAKPAQSKQKELAKEIRKLTDDLKKLEGDTKQEEKRLTDSIKSISAVLYHVIDGNTRIDDVVIGTP